MLTCNQNKHGSIKLQVKVRKSYFREGYLNESELSIFLLYSVILEKYMCTYSSVILEKSSTCYSQ